MEEFRDELESAKAKKAENLSINLLKMIESRIGEIVKIEGELKKKCPKLFQQRLPRFMRRRAASHQIKRIPKKYRPVNFSSKEPTKLLRFRRKSRFIKHKRILKRHARHSYRDPNKSVLHKWFAKRFKISKEDQVPLYNNTKNQRNLYRQTRYGCAYLSLAELICLRVMGEINTTTIERLNELTKSVSGFTFAARALEQDRYEVAVHIYKHLDKTNSKCICPVLVSKHKNKYLNLWVPREHELEVQNLISGLNVPVERVKPRDETRIRLVGPYAREEAAKLAECKKVHETAIEDVDKRLLRNLKFGLTIGRHLEEKHINFTYYQTHPFAVDLVFKGKPGRMLWHTLIKNKAHLVGGKRDVGRLLANKQCFWLVPDQIRDNPSSRKAKKPSNKKSDSG